MATESRQGGIYTMLKEDVRFTSEQMARYEELRKKQHTELRPLFSEIRKSKDTFYSLLYKADLADSLKNTLADSIGVNQKNLDLHMFDYFRDVRNICTEEQLLRFDSSIKKVVMRMTGRRGRNKTDSDNKISDNKP